MTQPAKSHEPSMEEILASIRRIIADDDIKPASAEGPIETAQPAVAPSAVAPKPAVAAKPAAPPQKPAAPKPPPSQPSAVPNNQDDIDALLAGLDADTSGAEVRGGSNGAVPDDEAAEEDVLELTEQMEVDEEPAFKTVQAQDDIEFSEARNQEPAAVERSHIPPPSRYEEPMAPHPSLVSPSTAAAVNSAFNALAQTVLSNNARTLEDLVKEMLRPMLKGWLDDNLPGLVEKIVRAEIERVSRGR